MSAPSIEENKIRLKIGAGNQLSDSQLFSLLRFYFDNGWLGNGPFEKVAGPFTIALKKSSKVAWLERGDDQQIDHEIFAAGRALSDSVAYTSLFDLLVKEDFRGRGLGKRITEALVKSLPGCRIYLTSSFGSEEFYEKLGFRKHKTAYAFYPDGESPYLV